MLQVLNQLLGDKGQWPSCYKDQCRLIKMHRAPQNPAVLERKELFKKERNLVFRFRSGE